MGGCYMLEYCDPIKEYMDDIVKLMHK